MLSMTIVINELLQTGYICLGMNQKNKIMLVEINTDKHIEGTERVNAYFEETLRNALQRYEDRITRLEVMLGDENNGKGADHDIRCMLEARIAGIKPIAVVHHADTVEKAVSGATERLKHSLEHTFGKLASHH